MCSPKWPWLCSLLPLALAHKNHSSEQLLTSTGTTFTNPTSQWDLITSDDPLFIVYCFHSLACLQLWGGSLTPHLALLICTDNFMSPLKQAAISNTLEKRAFFRPSGKRKNAWVLPCDITNIGLLLFSMCCRASAHLQHCSEWVAVDFLVLCCLSLRHQLRGTLLTNPAILLSLCACRTEIRGKDAPLHPLCIVKCTDGTEGCGC